MLGHGSTLDEELQRRGILQFIKLDSIHKYVHILDSIVRQHMDSEWAPKSNLKVLPLAKKLALSLSAKLFMGINNQNKIDEIENLLEVLHRGTGYVTPAINFPGRTAWKKARNASKMIHHEVCENIKRQKNEQHSEKWNLISYLLTVNTVEGKFLTEKEIASSVIGMLLGSIDTVSSLMTNLVYFLADHPDVYATALREQEEIRENLKDPEKTLTFEDTKRMTYGRNVINEVLRLESPVAGNFREVIDAINYKDFTIPKRWKVYWSVHSTHKDPKYFSHPEKFDPERFERNTHPPYTFTPFGGGAKMCPGHEYSRQAALVFMHHLLIKFNFQKLISDEKIIAGHVPVPAKGLPITLQRSHKDK